VDLPASKLGRFALPDGAGVVKSVRTGQPVPGTGAHRVRPRIAGRRPEARIETTDGVTRLVLEWPGDGKAVAALQSLPACGRQACGDQAAIDAESSIPSAPSRTSPRTHAAGNRRAFGRSHLAPGRQLPSGRACRSSPRRRLATKRADPRVPNIATVVPRRSPRPRRRPGATKSMQQLRAAGMRELVIAIEPATAARIPARAAARARARKT
jgi:N-acetylmuramoyl-L-alanine amidase